CDAAEQKTVDLQLVLAVDVSSSMSIAEQRIQREGYAAAMRSPDIIRAITSGPLGRIAVIYVEWGDYGLNPVQWTLIDGPATANKLAAKLVRLPFRSDVHTSISRALYFSAGLFDRRFVSDRKVIDISGNGPNNLGAPVTKIRDQVVGRGISINGLPITLR